LRFIGAFRDVAGKVPSERDCSWIDAIPGSDAVRAFGLPWLE
jgi:hypothetical protein